MADKIDMDKKTQTEESSLSDLSNPDHVTADLMTTGIKTTAETETLKQKFGVQENININERLNSKPTLEAEITQVQEQKLELNPTSQISQNQNTETKVAADPTNKKLSIPAPRTPYPPTILDRFMNYLAYLLKKLEMLLVGFLKKKEPDKVIFHKMNEILDQTKKKKKKKKDHDRKF